MRLSRSIAAAAATAACLTFAPPDARAQQKSPLPVVAPAKVGLSAERLARIVSVFRKEVDEGRIPGVVVAVVRRGKLAYFESVGFQDKAGNVPMRKDAVFSIASMTKPWVSLAIMMLVEEGRILLADPVGKYLPPLAAMKVAMVKTDAGGKQSVESMPAKRQPTVQDLLRHTSGFTYGARGDSIVHKMHPASSSASSTTWTSKEFVEHLGKLPLVHQPGTVWEYSVSTDILGLVVEAVSGKQLGAFLEERLFRPLGMVDSGFAVKDAQKTRYARALAKDPVTGKDQSVLHASGKTLKFECGGGCGVSTASDYIRFAQMLLNKGTLDGRRIVGRKTVQLMTANHLDPETVNNVPQQGYGFGLGFAVRLGEGRTPYQGSTGDYNWGGAFGTYFWVDPKEELAVVFMSVGPGPIRVTYRNMITSLVLSSIVD